MFASRVKDIMVKDVITVKTDTPMLEAMALVAKYDVSGLPVVDDDMNLIGILSEKDMISMLYELDDHQEKTVHDFMTQPALFFDEDESLLDVCDFLKKNVFRRVPITSRGKVVGIISVRDVVEYVLKAKRETAPVD
ncbi:MAG: CBS domain-containing protein [Planctomycetota bacterium]|jgi:CBS domain-containing protein